MFWRFLEMGFISTHVSRVHWSSSDNCASYKSNNYTRLNAARMGNRSHRGLGARHSLQKEYWGRGCLCNDKGPRKEWAAYSWVHMLRVLLRATLCSIRKCQSASILSHVNRVNVDKIGRNKTCIAKDTKITLHISMRRKSLLVLLKRLSTRVYRDED